MLSNKYPGSKVSDCAHPNILHLAKMLNKNNISYLYQPKLLMLSLDGNTETIVPSLYLPKYQTVIERLACDDYFDDGPRIKNLEATCRKNHYHLIPVHPVRQSTPDSPFPTLSHDQYQSYLFNSIKEFLNDRLEDFNKITGTK